MLCTLCVCIYVKVSMEQVSFLKDVFSIKAQSISRLLVGLTRD